MLLLPSSLPATVAGGDKILEHWGRMEPLEPAVSALLPPVKLIDVSHLVELLNEAHIDEIIGLGLFCSRTLNIER